jgi:hypothetical protein
MAACGAPHGVGKIADDLEGASRRLEAGTGHYHTSYPGRRGAFDNCSTVVIVAVVSEVDAYVDEFNLRQVVILNHRVIPLH